MICAGLSSCGKPLTLLERIKRNGELVVVTRNSPTTYFEGADGPDGFEYDLAAHFAASLGVQLRLKIADNYGDILPMVARGDADLAAAGLVATARHPADIQFGPTYQMITPELVYRLGATPPRSLDDLNGILEVAAGGSEAQLLRRLRSEHPKLQWREDRNSDSEELLYLVWQQVVDYTIADSNDVAINQQFYPELRVAFPVSPPQPLAWAFAKEGDNSLYNAALAFFDRIRDNGTLAQLIDRHYGHVQDFDYVGTKRYMAHVMQRLPEFRPMFQKAAKETGEDWRLLAAIGYQESHWNPRASSPTGVRGIMMLTRATMNYLGLTNRLNPATSILGGARYFEMVKAKIPERITEPDRTWLALAAYNIGYGHLEDARVLTQRMGGNPDKWIDVRKYLPLLSQKKYYRHLPHGYARGREPVRYVDNIRSYYDILVWMTERQNQPLQKPPAPDISITTPVL